MSRFASLRLIGPVAAAAALSLGTLPAFAQSAPASSSTDCSAIKFELANPAPGSRVELGNMVLQGVATDTRATPNQGVGIDRIDFFLGSRDQGGQILGTAVPGMVSGPFGPTSFQTTLNFGNQTGGRDLVAYAHSSVTGQVESVTVPIVLGEDPSAISEPTNLTQTSTCIGGGVSTSINANTTAPTTATAPATTTATTPATTTTPSTMVSQTGSAQSMVLNVGNPSPGDTVKAGAFSISGDAMDKAASTGTGIDRIDIFLDNRDNGGLFLSSAQLGPTSFWSATVNLPTNQTGLHELWFYAHSSVTGATTTVTVPVTIER
jgi:hypothetical protein